jgi:tetratricopeptide (TPR) repeat protein
MSPKFLPLKLIGILSSVTLLLLLISCLQSHKYIYTEDELSNLLKERLTEQELEVTTIPFKINESIKIYARRLVKDLNFENYKIDALIRGIIRPEKLNIKYNESKALTAIEVFVEGEANCIAYTNLFIGMAREVGLKAHYVDVTQVSRLKKEGEVVINSGHICAGVDVQGKFTLVDFAEQPRIGYRIYKIIDDLEAIANFANSLGVLKSFEIPKGYGAEEYNEDIKQYVRAIKIKPSFAKAYNNLGIACQRRRQYNLAIENYKKAIQFDPKLAAAHSNLGNAYYITGEYEKAIKQFKKAIALKGNNPYTRYDIALTYYYNKEYKNALEELEKAIDLEKNYAEAYNLLGLIHQAVGNKQAAIIAFKKALEIKPDLLQAKVNLKRYEKP